MDLNDNPELFASEPVPKRKARARRSPVVESEPETGPIAEVDAVATLRDLRAAGERFIREQPLLAVGLAVGAGYLIGRLRR